jgi:hypothetical protein
LGGPGEKALSRRNDDPGETADDAEKVQGIRELAGGHETPGTVAPERPQSLAVGLACQSPGERAPPKLVPAAAQPFLFRGAPLAVRLLPPGNLGRPGPAPFRRAIPRGLRGNGRDRRPVVPLSDIPPLSSLPGARASLYLDFDGFELLRYGQYANIVVPPFDQDGDPSSFNSAELTAIERIWSYVAEDFAPFQLNVTTVTPSSLAHGTTLRVVIGGDGRWTGAKYGGISYVNNFTNTDIPNVAFVFSENLARGNVRYTADAISHEAGHSFGLEHQSTYQGNRKIEEYSTGPRDGDCSSHGKELRRGAKSLVAGDVLGRSWGLARRHEHPCWPAKRIRLPSRSRRGFGRNGNPAAYRARRSAQWIGVDPCDFGPGLFLVHVGGRNHLLGHFSPPAGGQSRAAG